MEKCWFCLIKVMVLGEAPDPVALHVLGGGGRDVY
jgi:hypothetical protein